MIQELPLLFSNDLHNPGEIKVLQLRGPLWKATQLVPKEELMFFFLPEKHQFFSNPIY
ncbi:MAG TPA: hypothetical protein PK671_19915 [Candidatus Obscuribacter sp.]|nr:hypothetical protein [Candidatus Obscuribacter sp.]HMW90406.1 hypothetical protein [Candidatus Obscuribacter sp.]HMY55238.1 hypothetical protein [Candidatus Obscuribacter sp.]